MPPSVSDSGRGEDSIRITVDIAVGLIGYVRTLRDLARSSTEEHEIVCLSTAGILMAASAAEALLSEFAFKFEPELYHNKNRKEFREASAPKKYLKLVGVESEDLRDLWDKRIAIQHSEPDHQRSRMVGIVLNPAGVDRALKAVCAVAREVFAHHQKQMPADLEQAVRKS